MTYSERVKDFEKSIAPYISGLSPGIEYCGCRCTVYHFLSDNLLRVWRELGSRKVLILGSWGPRSLVVGMCWNREKWHSPDPVSRLQEWSRRYCPGMLEEEAWTLDGLKMKGQKR